MNCSNCGHQNPDDIKSCESCGYDFSVSESTQLKAKTSRLAIFSLVLAISSLLFFVFTGLPAMLFGYKSILNIRKSEGKLKGKSIAKAGIIIALIFICLYRVIMSDAPPIENDYTIKDIRSSSSYAQQSYAWLMSLADVNDNIPGATAIGLSESDLKNLNRINRILDTKNLDKISARVQENEDIIMSLWHNSKKGRDILTQLNEFPEIADLSSPGFELPVYLRNLRRLFMIHRAYIYLQILKGNHMEAMRLFVKLDSINKKLSLNARDIVTKLANIAFFAVEFQIANFIANNEKSPKLILLMLKAHIESFSEKHTSMKNSIIFEYLKFKNSSLKVRHAPLFKYNSTLKLQRNFLDKWIAIEENREPYQGLKVWPDFYPNLPIELRKGHKLPLYYKLYNPYGSLLASITRLNMEMVFKVRLSSQIESDMLKIALNKRLGEEIDLTARAYSDEYIIDIEKKYIISPGPNGKIGMGDDIKLPINPEVLGFTD